MFFFAYLGTEEHLPDWQRTVERHAVWLGLTPYLRSRQIAAGGVFAFGWVSLRPPDTSALLRETTDHIALVTMPPLEPWNGRFAPSKQFETGAVQLQASLRSGEVRISMPALGTEQFFWAADAKGWVFGNDMRPLIRWAGFELDEAGIDGLFRYDIIPAPLTLSRTIHRIPEGCMLTARPGEDEPRLEVTFEPPSSPTEPYPGDPAERVREALDSVLIRAPKSSTLLFSGGIDSGLMAARLAALGRTDVTLLNFTSGPSDLDGQYGPLLAQHLGLRCEQIGWNPSDVAAVLPNLGADFGFPFSDTAVIPSVLLTRHMERSEPRTPAVIEATGTMGFTAAERVRRRARIYSVPWAVRWLAGLTYGLGLWLHRSKVARAAATMRVTADIPLVLAASSVYPNVSGLAYRVGREDAERVERAMQNRMDIVRAAPNPADQTRMLWWLRLGMSQAKFLDPGRRRGIASIFPFNEPAMLRMSYGLSWDDRCPPGRSKFVLTELMARTVPRALINRPKRGFLLPYGETFGHPVMRAFARDVALSPSNPVLALCRPRALRKILARAEGRKSLSVPARRFLWAFVFVSAWIQQVTAAP